jgi:hypothetical protein
MAKRVECSILYLFIDGYLFCYFFLPGMLLADYLACIQETIKHHTDNWFSDPEGPVEY